MRELQFVRNIFNNRQFKEKCLLSGPQRNQLGREFAPVGVIKIAVSACCSLIDLIKKQEETTVLRVGNALSSRNVTQKIIFLVAV